MGFFRRAEKRQVYAIGSTDPHFISVMGGYGPTLSGVTVTEDSAMRNAAVWRAVNLTAGTVAGLPLKVYRDTPAGREELDHSLFDDPMYPELTWYEGIETLTASVLVWGDAYALKIYNEAGTRVARMLPLDPSTVTVRRDAVTPENPSGKLFKIAGLSEELTSAEILHIPGLSFDGVCGLSAVRMAKETLGTAIAAEQVASKMFDSGLLNGGILQAEGDMSDEQAAEAKAQWQAKTRGTVRSYEVALLSAGWKFIPTQIPPDQAQWLESRHFSVSEIARLFGMPPALLFEYMDTGNVEADKLGAQWLRFGLNALLRRIESRLSLHLLPRGTFCEFVREGLLQGTPKEQADVHAAALAGKWMTPDEVRAMHNLPPLTAKQKKDLGIGQPALPPAAPPTNEGNNGQGNADPVAGQGQPQG